MAEDNQIDGQLSLFDMMHSEAIGPKPDKPQTFADYVGQCKYCMWYGYGLYEPYGHKRKPGTEGQMCQWEVSRKGIPTRCKNHDFWKPSIYAIPKLCGNCRHSNCFHYQKNKGNDHREKDEKNYCAHLILLNNKNNLFLEKNFSYYYTYTALK